VPDENQRERRLAMLRPLLTISPQGNRGLAMLTRATTLADTQVEAADDIENISGNLISYCVREAIDSIFPKLGDPKIREVSERLVDSWRRVSAQPDADVAEAIREHIDDLSRALDAAMAGFLPRVSSFLGVLHPGISADISIPAMATLRDLNKAANAGLHGSTTHDEAVELLDNLLARLVDLVAPLAITVQQYQALIDTGDFGGLSDLLAGNSDPRIRVYIFERVRDPLLAMELDIKELLPSPSTWFAHGYVRHLADDHPAAFTQFVSRIPRDLLTGQVASRLLAIASFAGPHAAWEIDRLSRLAGSFARMELVARWLQGHVEDAPDAQWWRILTRLVGLLDTSRIARAPHGFSELIDLAMSRLPDAKLAMRSRFSAAILAALARLDVESPYTIGIYFDNRHTRALSASDIIIDTAARLVGFSQANGQQPDLSHLTVHSREALERAAIAPSIAMAPAELAGPIAKRAFEAILGRVTGDAWPGPDEHHTLEAVLPLLGPEALAALSGALGEPPPTEQVKHDIDNSAEVRAEWFRRAQWAAHLPERARPQKWVEALQASSECGVTFGPIPVSSFMAEPRAHESPLGDIDTSATSVPEFVIQLNAALARGNTDDPRFAMTLRETITAHAAAHREEWADDHVSIAQVQDLWVRRMIVASLKSETNDAPRLSWERLQHLWASFAAEARSLEAAETNSAKAPLSQLSMEILEHLRHRVAERPRAAADIDWWTLEVFPAVVSLVAWVGEDEPDIGLPALFSVRGEAVRLLVMLSSPIDEDAERGRALSHALELLASAAVSDPVWSGSLGHWARWLIHRAPDWWQRSSAALVGATSSPEIRHALLRGNFESGQLAPTLLGIDVPFLNAYASSDSEDVAYPVLAGVLWGDVPIKAIQQPTWSAIFRDDGAAEHALRFLFPEENLDDADAAGRLRMLRLVTADASRAATIWRSIDVLATSPDLSDHDLFAFAAELATANRGAPMSTYHLAERFVRSLANPDAVLVLESMCAGNLGGDRALAQYELTAVNESFQRERSTLPVELRTRVQHALFEIGFLENGS
jgi:hypothetical protein